MDFDIKNRMKIRGNWTEEEKTPIIDRLDQRYKDALVGVEKGKFDKKVKVRTEINKTWKFLCQKIYFCFNIIHFSYL